MLVASTLRQIGLRLRLNQPTARTGPFYSITLVTTPRFA